MFTQNVFAFHSADVFDLCSSRIRCTYRLTCWQCKMINNTQMMLNNVALYGKSVAIISCKYNINVTQKISNMTVISLCWFNIYFGKFLVMQNLKPFFFRKERRIWTRGRAWGFVGWLNNTNTAHTAATFLCHVRDSESLLYVSNFSFYQHQKHDSLSMSAEIRCPHVSDQDKSRLWN